MLAEERFALFGGVCVYRIGWRRNLTEGGDHAVPRQRNSTINQLSGGEKALTAVALVFSIFELNPAPFCLLDEVDAPLDDNNVGRFCETVRDMAQRVQFIFITHNKTTMEMADQLLGVTMNERSCRVWCGRRLIHAHAPDNLRLGMGHGGFGRTYVGLNDFSAAVAVCISRSLGRGIRACRMMRDSKQDHRDYATGAAIRRVVSVPSVTERTYNHRDELRHDDLPVIHIDGDQQITDQRLTSMSADIRATPSDDEEFEETHAESITKSNLAASRSEAATHRSSTDTPAKKPSTRKIIALRLVAGAQRFDGTQLKDAMETAKLRHGKYDIYHRYDDKS